MAKSKISKKKSVTIEGIMNFDENGALSFEVEDIDGAVNFKDLVDEDFKGQTVKVTVAVAEDL